MKQRTLKKLLLGGLVLAALSTGIGYYLWIPRGPIYEFKYERDAAGILDLFKTDRYWLVASEEYSPEFTLKYRAPNRDPRYLGQLNIKVLRQNDAFVGFTAYYMKKRELGLILFLAVKPEFRGKGYGQQLTKYATDELIGLGAKQINLVTRTSNLKAQALYNRLGFYETLRDDEGFVYFTYIP